MKSLGTLVIVILSAAGFPLLAQQPPSRPVADSVLSLVDGELMNSLDSKTAKAGDRVLLKTKSTVRAADGTDIPRGSKLIGHVIAAKPSSAADENAQVALRFDQIELKSGQTLPMYSEIKALSPSVDDASKGAADAGAPSPGAFPGHASGDMYGSSPPPMANTRIGNGAGTAPAAEPPGTLVAQTGSIAIRTTSIPGVLLAVHETAPHDPRNAQSSGILLGARRDIHLDAGTNVVLGVTESGANIGGN
ncbi:MAG: hypothetical protein WBF42_19105 [Terracidiphilus sp.]